MLTTTKSATTSVVLPRTYSEKSEVGYEGIARQGRGTARVSGQAKKLKPILKDKSSLRRLHSIGTWTSYGDPAADIVVISRRNPDVH
jgi:hypothetical protein